MKGLPGLVPGASCHLPPSPYSDILCCRAVLSLENTIAATYVTGTLLVATFARVEMGETDFTSLFHLAHCLQSTTVEYPLPKMLGPEVFQSLSFFSSGNICRLSITNLKT